MTHTPTPWVIHSKVRAIVPLADAFKIVPLVETDCEPEDVAHTIALFADPRDDMSEDETYANAFRLVASVNACAELPIEFLQEDGVRELLEVLRDARHHGLIYWEPTTNRGWIARDAMLDRIDALLLRAFVPSCESKDGAA